MRLAEMVVGDRYVLKLGHPVRDEPVVFVGYEPRRAKVILRTDRGEELEAMPAFVHPLPKENP